MSAPDASSVAVPLPSGEVRVPVLVEHAPQPWALVVLAHGAGAGHEHPFLAGLAGGLRSEGVSTVRFDFPYRAAGRRMPGPAAHAVRTWRAVADAVAVPAGVPWFAAGKSYGGRMASMAAAAGEIAPAGLVYLGYPLHPPGRPDKIRAAHLPDVVTPQLFVEGTRDPFVDPHEQLVDAVATCRDAGIRWIADAGHSFEVAGRRRPADEIGARLAPIVAEWVRAHV
ncbi:hypothetical protein GCM10027411_05040 [Microbacterium aureliae]